MKKKLIAAIAVALVVAAAPLANAKAVVTATPTKNVVQKGAVVTFKFAKLPAKNGVYIEECMAPATKGATPTVCDSDQSAQAWVSNVKADIAALHQVRARLSLSQFLISLMVTAFTLHASSI